jgi:hypothetical protein
MRLSLLLFFVVISMTNCGGSVEGGSGSDTGDAGNGSSDEADVFDSGPDATADATVDAAEDTGEDPDLTTPDRPGADADAVEQVADARGDVTEELDEADAAADVVPPPAAAMKCTTEVGGDFPPTAYRIIVQPEDGLFVLAIAYGSSHRYEHGNIEDEEFETTATGSATPEALSLTFDEGALSAASSEDMPGFLIGTADLEGQEEAWSLVCWPADIEMAYHYDAESGGCFDDAEETGLNRIPVPFLRETGNGECGDLRGADLNESNLGYPVLSLLDLRGADLTEAQLFFAHIAEASLQGTDLLGLQFGYANVLGTVDAFSSYPESCSLDGDQLACRQ